MGRSRNPAVTQSPLDEEDFGGVWDAYAPAIYGYCFRRTADSALAEDLVSIVFLEAWRRRDVVIAADKVLPWLYGIATNILRNQRRGQRRYDAALRRLGRPGVEPDIAESIALRLDDEANMREILRHVQELSALEREVLALCVWQELSPRDVALVLDVPEVTVRTRLHRAREHLRDKALPAAATPAAALAKTYEGADS